MDDPYIIGLAVAGWLATTWLAYRWGLRSQNLQREHAVKNAVKERRRLFVAFMESWKHEIGRTFLCQTGGGFEYRESSFKDLISPFIHEAGLVKRDFSASQRKEFETLCGTLIGWQHKSIYGTDLCHKAQKEMGNIIAFVEKTGL